MAGTLTEQFPEMAEAFSERPDVVNRIWKVLSREPNHTQLFCDIGNYVCQLKRRLPLAATSITASEHTNKKRKLENGQDNSGSDLGVNGAKASASAWANIATQPSWKALDVSFSIPQRKKLHMEIVKDGSRGADGGIRALNPASGTIEFGASWKDIEQVFCLPIPEKTKRQHNFIVIPRYGDGISAAPSEVTPPEPIVWTFVEATGKEIKEGVDPGPGATANAINEHLAVYGKKVVFPDEKQFASAIPESHRKGETAFHVKGFRGSKEGYLYFTSVGILFGFKKPLAYFAFENVTSISYTSVLQRTFNLVITAPSTTQKDQDIEFSMIDQQDYAGIDTYVKKHGLNDASMAAARKAKRLNINGPPQSKTENGETIGAGEDDETELQKAERLLQDEEDEMEEDYNPESDGDSDDSGSGSGEDDEGDNDEEDAYDEEEEEEEEDRDTVAEELGSEAEEVEMSGEE